MDITMVTSQLPGGIRINWRLTPAPPRHPDVTGTLTPAGTWG